MKPNSEDAPEPIREATRPDGPSDSSSASPPDSSQFGAPTSESPMVDWAQTLKQTAGNEKMAREMAKIYLDESEKLMGQIRTALDAGEAKQLARTCHTLKGASGYFSAVSLVAAAQKLENHGHSGDLSGAASVLDELAGLVTRLAEELKAKTIE